MYIKKLAAVLVVLVLFMTATPMAMAAESGSAWDQVKAAGSDIWGTVKEKAPGVWDKTKEKASDLYDKAKEKAPEVKEKVQSGVSNAQEKISDYRAGQEEEFWQWFDNQTTGGNTKTTTSSSSTQESADNTAQITPDADDVSKPDAVPADDGDESQDDTGDIPAEVLEKYAEGEILYYRPDDTAHEALNPEEREYDIDSIRDEREELDAAETRQGSLGDIVIRKEMALGLSVLLVVLVLFAYWLGQSKRLGSRMYLSISSWWDGVKSALRGR